MWPLLAGSLGLKAAMKEQSELQGESSPNAISLTHICVLNHKFSSNVVIFMLPLIASDFIIVVELSVESGFFVALKRKR